MIIDRRVPWSWPCPALADQRLFSPADPIVSADTRGTGRQGMPRSRPGTCLNVSSIIRRRVPKRRAGRSFPATAGRPRVWSTILLFPGLPIAWWWFSDRLSPLPLATVCARSPGLRARRLTAGAASDRSRSDDYEWLPTSGLHFQCDHSRGQCRRRWAVGLADGGEPQPPKTASAISLQSPAGTRLASM